MKILAIILAATLVLTILPLAASADSTELQGFDRETCYSTCACATGMFVACSACRAQCDRQFWKEWDKSMSDDSDSKKRSKKSR
jgi:hypothetical protein